MVAEDGSNLGVLPTDQALKRAQEVGLDLVEVNPKGTPPVCKILDFGKYKYEEKKKAAEAKRKQTVVEVKEVKIRPKTDEHDLNVKIRAIRRFVESGNKAPAQSSTKACKGSASASCRLSKKMPPTPRVSPRCGMWK